MSRVSATQKKVSAEAERVSATYEIGQGSIRRRRDTTKNITFRLTFQGMVREKGPFCSNSSYKVQIRLSINDLAVHMVALLTAAGGAFPFQLS